jgi:hypothetical protein
VSVPVGAILRSGWKGTHREIRRVGRLAFRTGERALVGWRDPEAYAFYRRLIMHPYDPEYLIQALPRHRAIYLAISKVANTRIKRTLSQVENDGAGSRRVHSRKRSGLKGPRELGIVAFHRLVRDPQTLCFAFVRNPYDRLVSCWADKYQANPLVGGSNKIDAYLHKNRQLGLNLPEGAEQTMSFGDFVIFVTEQVKSPGTARLDSHWDLQSRIIGVPGIELNFIGKLESFQQDMTRVLDHLGADDAVRQEAMVRVRPSSRGSCAEYYTDELAARVYRAYEQDFDRFGYSRVLPR